MAKLYHTNAPSGRDAAKFREVNDAYNILKSAENIESHAATLKSTIFGNGFSEWRHEPYDPSRRSSHSSGSSTHRGNRDSSGPRSAGSGQGAGASSSSAGSSSHSSTYHSSSSYGSSSHSSWSSGVEAAEEVHGKIAVVVAAVVAAIGLGYVLYEKFKKREEPKKTDDVWADFMRAQEAQQQQASAQFKR